MRFSRILFGLGWLLSGFQSAGAADLQALDQQAKAYAQRLTPTAPDKDNSKDARKLMDAADILVDKGGCGTVLKIRMYALSVGFQPDYSTWMAIANSATCDHAWDDASKAALAMVGATLEKRANWSEDWRAAAITVYQQVLEMRPVSWIEKRLAALTQVTKKKAALRIEDIYPLSDQSYPAFCLNFSPDMPAVEDYHYQDYIEIEPAIPAIFSLNDDDEICVQGVDFGAEYKVLVRKGMRAGDKILAEDEHLSIEIDHKPPSFWFNRSAYVLPVTKTNAVPLYSINTEQVELRLARIHERNILSAFVQRNFQTDLSGYELQQVVETVGELVWQGSAKLDTPIDETGHTVLPLPDNLLDEPGLYLLAAS